MGPVGLESDIAQPEDSHCKGIAVMRSSAGQHIVRQAEEEDVLRRRKHGTDLLRHSPRDAEQRIVSAVHALRRLWQPQQHLGTG